MSNDRNVKAGIITIHFPYNYGAMLQAYATQKFLDKNNIKNEIIDFRPYEIDKDYHIRYETFKKKPKLFLHMCVAKALGKRKKYQRFEKFIKSEMRLSSKRYRAIHSSDCSDYDVLIAGSDQIWNPDIMRGRYEYVLNFGEHMKKISYASSFGKDEIGDDECEKLKEQLIKYSHISVREKQGIEILRKM